MGNINNVYNSPARPAQPKAEAPKVAPAPVKPDPPVTGHANGGAVPTIKAPKKEKVDAVEPRATQQAQTNETPERGPSITESAATAVQNALTSATGASAAAVSSAVAVVAAAMNGAANAVKPEVVRNCCRKPYIANC